MSRPRILLVVLALLMQGLRSSSATQSGAAGVSPRPGGVTLAGRVISDEEPGRAIRRAIVTVAHDTSTVRASAVTDDDGRFALAGLPAGRLTVVATRPGFLTSAYGARRPARPGTPIVAMPGAEVVDVVIRLWRGAAISGVVRDDRGRPLEGVTVLAVGAAASGMFASLSNNGQATDNRGEFRIFGLEPGNYLIRANAAARTGSAVAVMPDTMVDEALSRLRARQPTARVGVLRTAPPPTSPQLPLVDYAPVYYPGTAAVDEARFVSVGPGDDLSGIEIGFVRVPSASVHGVVLRRDGSGVPGASVQLVSAGTGSPAPDVRLATTSSEGGQFSLGRVGPGRYVAIARLQAPASPGRASASRPTVQWASADVAVAGGLVEGVTLLLDEGLSVFGQVRFVRTPGSLAAKLDLRAVEVGLLPASVPAVAPNAALAGRADGSGVGPDGGFAIHGLRPGAEVRVFLSKLAPGVFPATATLAGHDLLDGPIELRRELTANQTLEVVLTDVQTELTGTLATSGGEPVPDVYIIVFPSESRFWGRPGRRLRAVRPDLDGRYLFQGLPPGEYLLGVLTDIDQDEWLARGFLERLAPAAVPITLAPGERRSQDLKVGGGVR